MMLKITPGEWIVIYEGNVFNKSGNRLVAAAFGYSSNVNQDSIYEEDKANAEFIAEAGTIANATGLMPSELLAQRDELVNALKDIEEYWNGNENERAMADACYHVIDVAISAIAKVENKS
jgi:hypothetical protein